MSRSSLVACLAALVALHLVVHAAAPPKKGSELYTIMKARLFEVDETFYNKVAKARWNSKADLEEWEAKPQPKNALFAQLEKQQPFLIAKEVNIDPDKEGVLLTAVKPMNYLPTPDQLRRGKKAPQTIDEGFTLSARVHLTADRRFVRVKFAEQSAEIEGVEKITTLVDNNGNEAVGELVSVKEANSSATRYIPDGGSILLPILARPPAVKKKGRWLVAEITPRIYIEAEERERRGQGAK